MHALPHVTLAYSSTFMIASSKSSSSVREKFSHKLLKLFAMSKPNQLAKTQILSQVKTLETQFLLL
jgi:hypothetical protein